MQETFFYKQFFHKRVKIKLPQEEKANGFSVYESIKLLGEMQLMFASMSIKALNIVEQRRTMFYLQGNNFFMSRKALNASYVLPCGSGRAPENTHIYIMKLKIETNKQTK